MSARLDAQDEKLLADRKQRRARRRLRKQTDELVERATTVERQSEDLLRRGEQLVLRLRTGGER